MDGRALLVLDTSVLINFLAIGRTDLLAAHPRYRFVVTEHARAEITDHYPAQLARLQAALAAGHIEETVVSALDELTAFAALSADKKLGQGECASIAAASLRRLAVGMDDKAAIKRARAFDATLAILTTADLIVSMIKQGQIDVIAADAIKLEWQTHHRFTLKIATFQDLL